MEEDNFIYMLNQATIYSSCFFGDYLLLSTGSQGKIYAYSPANDTIEQLPLYDLPFEADIIAIESSKGGFPALGIALTQKLSHSRELDHSHDSDVKGYLNIYSSWSQSTSESCTESPLDSALCSNWSPTKRKSSSHDCPPETRESSHWKLLGRNCKSFKLKYLPYHLFNFSFLKSNGEEVNLFLLSGSDKRIHCYESVSKLLSFSEAYLATYFHEISHTFPSIVTRISIHSSGSFFKCKRIIICGCEDGSFYVWISNLSNMNASLVIDSYDHTVESCSTPLRTPEKRDQALVHASPIFSNLQNDDGFLNPSSQGSDEEELECDDSEELSINSSFISQNEDLVEIKHHYEGLVTAIKYYTVGCQSNIVVCSGGSPVYVYENVWEERFSKGRALKFSSCWGCVLTCCVADVDQDDELEIIVGTYGCTVLVYKFMHDSLRWVITGIQKLPSAISQIHFAGKIIAFTRTGIHSIVFQGPIYGEDSKFTEESEDDSLNPVSEEPKDIEELVSNYEKQDLRSIGSNTQP